MTTDVEERDCYICARGWEDDDCNCWEDGPYWDGHCTGHTPSHCCLCGGSPYCDCCGKCGNRIDRCGCPIAIQLQDGGEVIL